ncbi:MAG: HU family DNA-binding protein [Candidatus Aminicenantes bacterium]|nr:HU family DNA-binding protein [Candidatus Aminicenantes bacterium]
MIKNDLVLAIEKNTNLSHSKAITLVEAILKFLKQGLIEDGEVEIRGFGSFRLMNKKTGIGRDIWRKSRLAIPKGKRVKFCCGQELKGLILEDDEV